MSSGILFGWGTGQASTWGQSGTCIQERLSGKDSVITCGNKGMLNKRTQELTIGLESKIALDVPPTDVKKEIEIYTNETSIGTPLLQSSGCTGNFSNCQCGCQDSYGRCCGQSLQMQLDVTELIRLEQSCTCTQCGKSFHNSSNLRRHKRKHFNAYTHVCTICGRKFFRSDVLKLHMKNVHKVEQIGKSTA